MDSFIKKIIKEEKILEEIIADLKVIFPQDNSGGKIFFVEAFDYLEIDNEIPSENTLTFKIDLNFGISLIKYSLSKYFDTSDTINIDLRVKPNVQTIVFGKNEIKSSCYFLMSYQYRNSKTYLIDYEIAYIED